jgi:hypothetical protein
MAVIPIHRKCVPFGECLADRNLGKAAKPSTSLITTLNRVRPAYQPVRPPIARRLSCESWQTAGMPLEDQERVIHVLVVGSIEEAQLLLSVGRIVGGIDIEQDFAALPNLLSAEAYEGVEPAIVRSDELAGRGRVFPATEGGLGTQGLTQGLISEQLEGRIMA